MQVHPFVYQIYKSSVCFLTSFIVLAWNWPAKFTWWGTVSISANASHPELPCPCMASTSAMLHSALAIALHMAAP